jgi:hypothetical protein
MNLKCKLILLLVVSKMHAASNNHYASAGGRISYFSNNNPQAQPTFMVNGTRIMPVTTTHNHTQNGGVSSENLPKHV